MTDVNVLILNNQADIRTPEDLLMKVLPRLVESMPTVDNAVVYRLAHGGMVVWQHSQTAESSGAFYVLEVDSPYQQAIEQQEYYLAEDQQLAIAPMLANGDVFALLVAEYSETPPPEVLIEVAADLSLALYNRHLNRLLQRQISAMALLNEAQTLSDVAAIVAQTMAEAEQYIGMNVFEFDADGKVSGARVISTANRHQAYNADIEMPLEQAALQWLHDVLLDEGDFLISDVSTETRFSPAGREWLKEQKAQSAYLIPMPLKGRLDAFLTLIDTHRSLAPSDMEMTLFQNVGRQAASVIEKQNLLEQTRQSAEQSTEQARVMRLLNDLIAQINTEQDEIRILRRTAEVLLETTRVDHVGIVINQGGRAKIVSETPSHGIIDTEIEAGSDSVSALLNKQRRPLVILDIAEDSNLPPKNREVLEQIGAKSLVLLPMFDVNNHLLGSVGLDYYTKQDSISPAVVDMAQTVVAQVVLSLQKVRLLAQSQQQAKQLQHITDFGQKLRAYLGAEEIVRTALHASRDLLSLDYVAIMLYERPTNSLCYAGEVRDGEAQVTFPGEVVDLEADMIAAHAWQKREMMYVDDLQADWEWKHPLERQLQTMIAQPLTSAGVVLGIMEIGHRAPSAYNAVDITTFQQMCNQLAIALSNAAAYAQSQTLARNKVLANEIISKMQQQTDVADILEVTVQELGRALGAKRGRIRLGTERAEARGDIRL